LALAARGLLGRPARGSVGRLQVDVLEAQRLVGVVRLQRRLQLPQHEPPESERVRHRLLVLGQQRHVAQQQPRLPVVQHRELPRAALAGHRLAVGGRDGERQQRPQQRRIALHRDERVEAEGRADRARRVRVDGVARRDEERVQRPRHL